MTDDTEQTPSLIEFPCEFPIKVMGKNTADFRALVLKTSNTLIDKDRLLRIDEQLSSNEKYLSCTIVATFDDQASIDAVYQHLTASPLVLMAL
ncbi:DUF493 domain-containing protein [Suttonella sp. R2A3]|uniref:YbeD family protein n=1 Tax=Suttonella sp. R2A3 TaxID=2908648 RepID=UPI001F261B15|nr:DUF493 domain-containing protein [Suttonella sp. R2A3]UJF24298.1 DUF493 domain-containing protein [Suttonella sp. R2A3]